MKKSNIFAYIELRNLVESLNASKEGRIKQDLKLQSAYFNIIEPRYLSDDLIKEWESILATLKQNGAKLNEEGKVISHAVSNTIDSMSDKECQCIVERVFTVFEKLRVEFDA